MRKITDGKGQRIELLRAQMRARFTTILFVNKNVIEIRRGSHLFFPDPGAEHRVTCHIPGLENRKQFYQYFTEKEYNCENLRWFGSRDGRKAVCMDMEFYLVPQDCHVLSFGINNEWSFDDKFGAMGCKVYSFDPTMGKADHQRSQNVQFFRLGISNIKGQRKVGMGSRFDFFEVDRYVNILERLGLTNTTIDYLKLDVELSELEFFQDIFRNTPHLLNNIKQIAVELHHGYHGKGLNKTEDKTDDSSDMSPTSTYQIFWQYFHELRCHGFKLFHARRNGRWTEAVWGNI
ncbi:uncharacterized protein [Macrobrachium rosenbergii]|uniref:uncharacterized protein n=1 Tax=Macrobrachium rosenbergii TaxID=79674 RepID=UPI0034D74599